MHALTRTKEIGCNAEVASQILGFETVRRASCIFGLVIGRGVQVQDTFGPKKGCVVNAPPAPLQGPTRCRVFTAVWCVYLRLLRGTMRVCFVCMVVCNFHILLSSSLRHRCELNMDTGEGPLLQKQHRKFRRKARRDSQRKAITKRSRTYAEINTAASLHERQLQVVSFQTTSLEQHMSKHVKR